VPSIGHIPPPFYNLDSVATQYTLGFKTCPKSEEDENVINRKSIIFCMSALLRETENQTENVKSGFIIKTIKIT